MNELGNSNGTRFMASALAVIRARREMLREIDDLLIGAILGATEGPEAWAMIAGMARTYREKIEAALGGKEP